MARNTKSSSHWYLDAKGYQLLPGFHGIVCGGARRFPAQCYSQLIRQAVFKQTCSGFMGEPVQRPLMNKHTPPPDTKRAVLPESWNMTVLQLQTKQTKTKQNKSSYIHVQAIVSLLQNRQADSSEICLVLDPKGTRPMKFHKRPRVLSQVRQCFISAMLNILLVN